MNSKQNNNNINNLYLEENRNFDEEVTTSKPEEDIDLDDQANKSCKWILYLTYIFNIKFFI